MSFQVFRRLLRTVVLGAIAGVVVAAEHTGSSLFAELDTAIEEARAIGAELLSPTNYMEALEHYGDAKERLERGQNVERIQREIDKASQLIARAVEVSRVASVQLVGLIEIRQNAIKVNAADYAPELWAEAESVFRRAAIAIEDGETERARQYDAQSKSAYRNAELVAIKRTYLDDTRALLAQADDAEVGKYAPITLGRARELLAQAEAELSSNRYDIDLPLSLARQAEYEARHALHIAQLAKAIEDEELTAEELILDWETPINQIATEADLVPLFDDGYGHTTEEIIEHMAHTQSTIQQLEQDVADRDREIDVLHQDLGGMTEQRRELAARIKDQERMKAQLRRIEGMFTRQEAQVFREGNNIFLRLVGLSFPVGEASIGSENFYLLTKVQNAIELFPGCTLVIEGHTDSMGRDSDNDTLSKERASAVREYLITHTQLEPARITSIGYGETRPIANNETASGRAKNRRIEVLIRPAMSTG